MKPLGLDFIQLGLNDVLYFPESGEIYTPNTNQRVDVDQRSEDVIKREIHGPDGRIVDNEPDDAGSSGVGSENGDSSGDGLTDGGQSGIIMTDTRFDMAVEKIEGFLLRPGAKHFDHFIEVGYTPDDGQKLYDDISAQFDMSKATAYRTNPDGNPGFSIFMELGVTTKKRFRTTWEMDPKTNKPRFTSAYQNTKRR